jgi:hypothetical protein
VSIEERVRAATRARTALVRDVRPLEFPDELPARARRNDRALRWLTWGAPIGAAALVTALALVLVMLRQVGGPQSGPAASTSATASAAAAVPASIPRYYVALAYVSPASSNPIEAVVGDDRTGRKLAVITPSASQNFYGVTGAADDRTFVLMNYDNAQQETTFYLLRLTPGAAHPTQLTELPIKGIVAHVNGLALSPDGRELAVMYRFATTATNASTHLLIYSMSSGAELAVWNTAGPNNNARGGDPNSEGLSWINGDRSVDFGWIATTGPSAQGLGTPQVRTVDVTPGGHDLLADSRLVLPVPSPVFQGTYASDPCSRWLATSDGRAIVCGGAGSNGTTSACPAAPPSFTSYSAATGKPLQILYRYHGQCVNGQALLAWINPSGSQAIGFILMDKVVNGKNTSVPNLFGVAAGGRFTPLAALPFHQDAVISAGGLAF